MATTATPRAPRTPAAQAAQTAAGAAQTPRAAPQAGQVAVRASTALGLPADMLAELAAAAKEDAAKERPAISKISFKGGMVTVQGNPVPGDAVDMVLLAAAYRNTFYGQAYDPDNIVNPSCFAIMPNDDDMVPHENVAEPEHDKCAGCPRNEWGSDPRPSSRGKACKETRRLIGIPIAALESVEAINTAEMAMIDVPVTSVKNYGNYVNTLAAALKRPMWAVTTRVSVVRDPKTQFKVLFTPTDAIDDPALLTAVRARLEEAQRIVLTPYDETFLAGKAPEPDPKVAAKTSKFKAK